MSRKRKRGNGNPHNRSPKRDSPFESLSRQERFLLLSLRKPAPAPGKIETPAPIPLRTQPYRIGSLAAFNPIYDGDAYFEDLRSAFAQEMKLLTGDFYPETQEALRVHKEFIKKLMDEISLRIPGLATETSGMIERHFRDRFKKRGQTDTDFERWDHEVLGGFFADNMLFQRCLNLGGIEYFDEIAEGASPLAVQDNFSYTQYVYMPGRSDIGAIQPSLTISSKLVNQALRQGYSIDEIVEGLVQKTVSYEILNIANRIHEVDLGNKQIGLQMGLTISTLEYGPDGTPTSFGGWGHNALISALHVRLNPLYGLGYRNEAELFEILSQTDPTFFERAFEACFGVSHSFYPEPHLLFEKQIALLAERVLDESDPALSRGIQAEAHSSLSKDTLPRDLQSGIYALLAMDPSLTSLGLSVQEVIANKSSDLAFYTPPGMLGDFTR